MRVICSYFFMYALFFCSQMCFVIPSAWAYQGFDFTKRSDIKSIRAQHIHTGMVARLSERTLLRFYVGSTPEAAEAWMVKMIDHYKIYRPTLDVERSETYGYNIYVAQGRIYCTHRYNIGYCVDIFKDPSNKSWRIFLEMGDLLLEGEVDTSTEPSIIRHTSVDTEGNEKNISHFTIEVPKGTQMLYKGGVVDQSATIVGRKSNANYIGFQQLPSHIYLFDSYGYGRAFVRDEVLGFKEIIHESEANPHDLPQKTEQKVSAPE